LASYAKVSQFFVTGLASVQKGSSSHLSGFQRNFGDLEQLALLRQVESFRYVVDLGLIAVQLGQSIGMGAPSPDYLERRWGKFATAGG
jgi:hypothetical protein